MALIKCPVCGNEISDKVNNCPNCNFDIGTYCRKIQEEKNKKEKLKKEEREKSSRLHHCIIP